MRKLDGDDELTERLLEKARERYEAGIKSELLVGLTLCIMARRSVPDWLAKAFFEACLKVWEYQVKSYDDVFGKPLKKGKRQGTARRNLELTPAIWEAARGQNINKALFETIGKKFGVSGTVAAELYYSFPKKAREALSRMGTSGRFKNIRDYRARRACHSGASTEVSRHD